MPNEWDIPELDIALAADRLVPPVTKWGTRRRSDRMTGTYHYYTHDFKFTRLIQRPEQVPATGCVVAVEPNYTITPETPRAEALWKIYLKRKLAAAWQAAGVRIVVDLNLDSECRHHDIGLLGVPPGWPAYATRAHRGVPFEQIEREFDLAARHSGGGVRLFCVFGGGRKVKAATLARGWVHAPEHRQVVQGIAEPYG
jgi:hypothetical protein